MQTQFENKSTDSVEYDFTRVNIESQGDKVRLVDSDEDTGLDLFCYTRCTNDDDDFLKQCRGLVFNNDNLVLKAFSYTPEYDHTQMDILEQLLSNFSKWSFYDAHEGALLRLFHFSGRWFLSTHRKLNAFRSKWATRDSFGSLFKRALESEESTNEEFAKRLPNGENILDRFQATLDKDKQYMFLLCNNSSNRIVCQPPKRPTVYHVGTFLADGSLSMEVDCGVSYPQKHSFLNIDELLDHVEKKVDPRLLQGIVCFGPDNRQVKILHKEYQFLFRARGNEPSIPFRYLQVRMDKRLTDMLYYLYPDSAETFDKYENILYEIARMIFNAYKQRFIKKNFVTVPHEEYKVVEMCHTWHLADPKNNRISLERVIYSLNKQPPTNLNKMIRRYKMEQQNATQPRTLQSTNSPALTGLTPEVSPGLTPLILKKVPVLKLPK
uniref:Uncharacterized protein n=1 Tax=viral metagenome TaxID=1070528 RepID=A0A6C0ELT8_9ZZZZ